MIKEGTHIDNWEPKDFIEYDLKILRQFTKGFLDVKPILTEHRKALAKVRSLDRRLKTIETKYKFIPEVIGINARDSFLVNAVKRLFKQAGFKKVVHFKNEKLNPKREDLQLWTEDELFIVEVKGVSKSSPQKHDLMQVLPYFRENENRVKDHKVFGLIIINHDNKKPFKYRSSTFKDAEKHRDAVLCNYGFISTIDLIWGFLLLKTGKMTFEEFKEKLKQFGLITYDSKGGQTLEK